MHKREEEKEKGSDAATRQEKTIVKHTVMRYYIRLHTHTHTRA